MLKLNLRRFRCLKVSRNCGVLAWSEFQIKTPFEWLDEDENWVCGGWKHNMLSFFITSFLKRMEKQGEWTGNWGKKEAWKRVESSFWIKTSKKFAFLLKRAFPFFV